MGSPPLSSRAQSSKSTATVEEIQQRTAVSKYLFAMEDPCGVSFHCSGKHTKYCTRPASECSPCGPHSCIRCEWLIHNAAAECREAATEENTVVQAQEHPSEAKRDRAEQKREMCNLFEAQKDLDRDMQTRFDVIVKCANQAKSRNDGEIAHLSTNQEMMMCMMQRNEQIAAQKDDQVQQQLRQDKQMHDDRMQQQQMHQQQQMQQ